MEVHANPGLLGKNSLWGAYMGANSYFELPEWKTKFKSNYSIFKITLHGFLVKRVTHAIRAVYTNDREPLGQVNFNCPL